MAGEGSLVYSKLAAIQTFKKTEITVTLDCDNIFLYISYKR
jgi:hypothetical protein